MGDGFKKLFLIGARLKASPTSAHAWSIWSHKKHMDKRSCSTPGVVDLEGKYTTMAKAVVPHSKQEGHWDAYAADDVWKAKCGKRAGNRL